MAKKYNVYTDKHIDLFITTFTQLIDMFGLSDFSVRYMVTNTDKYSAHILYDIENRWANVQINKNMLSEASEEACIKHMRCHAAHEFAHLLTAELYRGGVSKDYTSADMSRFSEQISRKFEYAIDKIIPIKEVN
jgi:hypothetical protein